jgi:hypothetical protein
MRLALLYMQLLIVLRAEATQEQAAGNEADSDEEEESTTFQEIDKLQNQGINAGDIQKLKTGVCVLSPKSYLR